MTLLKCARFNERELVGLDEYKNLLNFIFAEASEVIYIHKICALSRCHDLAAAQRMLDFEITLVEHYIDQFYLVWSLEEEDSYLDISDEFNDIKSLEKLVKKQKFRIQKELDKEQNTNGEKEKVIKIDFS